MLFYVFFVCKCVLYYCHQVSTQLQLTNISISKSNIQKYSGKGNVTAEGRCGGNESMGLLFVASVNIIYWRCLNCRILLGKFQFVHPYHQTLIQDTFKILRTFHLFTDIIVYTFLMWSEKMTPLLSLDQAASKLFG